MLQIPAMLVQGFFQKFLLSAFCGLVLACGIQFYRHIIQAGDRALNGKYQKATYSPLDPGLSGGGGGPKRK